MRDIARRSPGDVLLEDAPDDLGLGSDDDSPAFVARNRGVAIGQTTGDKTLSNATSLSPADFVGVVLTI